MIWFQLFLVAFNIATFIAFGFILHLITAIIIVLLTIVTAQLLFDYEGDI